MHRRFMVNIMVIATTVACLLCSKGSCQRVLIVTSEQQHPAMYSPENGGCVVRDLVAAGYPSDVVAYGRFINIALGDHDMIFLNSHTSPVPVSDLTAKRQVALQEGREIFINGDYPYRRYDSNSTTLLEMLNYSVSLFNVIDADRRRAG